MQTTPYSEVNTNGELKISSPKFIVALYARISPKGTGRRKDEETSLDIQITDNLQLVDSNLDWRLYETYDETVSGSLEFKNRPEGNKLLSDAREGKFNLVVVHDNDRLGRDMEGLAAKIFRSDMRRLGIQIYSKNQPLQPKDPDEYIENPYDEGQILQEMIHDWQSASTITKFRRRSMKGRIERIKSGKMINTPPYGFKLEALKDKKGQIVIRKDGRVVNVRVVCKREAVIVVRVYHEYVFEGKSMNEIRDGLNKDGIPTRKGRSWERAMVGRILKNPVYFGALVYNKHFRRKDPLTGKTKWGKNPPEKWIIVTPDKTEHPAIIDKPLFDRAQEVRKAKLRVGSVAVYSEFLFSGLLKCKDCQSKMYKKKVTSRYKRKSDGVLTKSQSNGYVCGRWQRFKDVERIYISEKAVKDAVLYDLKAFKDNPQALKGFLEESDKKDIDTKKLSLEQKKKSLCGIDMRYGRLLKAYELGKISLTKFEHATDELGEEEKKFKNDIVAIEKELASNKEREIGKKDFVLAVNNFDKVFSNNDIKNQKRLLRSLVESITIGKDSIKINYLLNN